MKLQAATQIADEIIHALRPDCVKIQVAGSVRRRLPHVKDIEIVYISQASSRQDLFGSTAQVYFHTNVVLIRLINDGVLIKDATVKRWGSKYKRTIHCASGIVIEMFRAVPHNWGYILTLRTGPAAFNKLLVTKHTHGGALPPHIELRDGFVWHNGKSLPIPTELAFFTALNLPLIPPRDRTPLRLRRCIENRRNQ